MEKLRECGAGHEIRSSVKYGRLKFLSAKKEISHYTNECCVIFLPFIFNRVFGCGTRWDGLAPTLVLELTPIYIMFGLYLGSGLG